MGDVADEEDGINQVAAAHGAALRGSAHGRQRINTAGGDYEEEEGHGGSGAQGGEQARAHHGCVGQS